jgi:hypothetical protein
MARRRTPYWSQNRNEVQGSLVQLSAEAVGLLAYRRPNLSARQCHSLTNFVFEVAASRLPDVQTNEFWPHFHREVERLSGATCSRSDLIDLFRLALRGAFPDRLDDIRASGVHAYYIALIFEQGGIGANRKRLIGSFLDRLLGLIRRGGDLDAIRPAEAVASFSKGNPHERAIDPLIPVLIEISTAVLGFAKFLRDRPDRLELAELSWSELASLWRRSSGIDPESLTPSAQELLHEVVRGLARVITREEAFRCVREDRFRLTVPGPEPDAVRTASSPMEIPIGPARIDDALGSRDVVLLDHSDFPPDVLIKHAGKGWQETDDGLVFRVEVEPFAESTPDGRRLPAVPLWIGETIHEATIAGRYWGAHLPIPSELVPGTRTTKRLWVKSTLRVYEGRLRLYVNWFSAPAAMQSDEATLSLGSRIVWTGQIEEGRPANFRPLGLNLEAGDLEGTSIRLCARTWSDAFVCTTLHAAFLDETAFLVCGGQIVPALSEFPVLARGDGTFEELILYRMDATEMSVTGARVSKEAPCELAGWRFVAAHLDLGSDSAGTIQIIAGLTEWNLAIHRKVYFRTDGHERVQLGNVTAVGSAAMIPALRDGVPNLVLEKSAGWPSESAPSHLVLHVRAGREVRVALAPAHFQRADGTWKVCLKDVFAQHVPHLAAGPIEVGLGIWSRVPDQWVTFFIFQEPPRVQPCRLDSQSTLIPVWGADWPTLSSGWIVDQAALESHRIASSAMACGPASLTFQWLPTVEDLVIGHTESLEEGGRLIRLNAIGGKPIPAQAIGPPGSEWSLNMAGEMLTISSGATRDIRPAILSSLARAGSQSIGIHAHRSGSDEPALTWQIDAAPRVSEFTFDWSHVSSSGIAVVTCEIAVHSAVPLTGVIEFLASGRVASTQTVELGRSQTGAPSVSVAGDIVLRPVDGDTVSFIVVRGLCNDVLFFSRDVPAPALSSAVSADLEAGRSAAAQLLRSYCEQRSESIGEMLLLRVLLHSSMHRELPIPGSQIQQKIRDSAEQTATDAVLSYCIAVLQSILSGNAVPAVGDNFSHCTPVLKALAFSLRVFHCHVMSLRGLLVPSRLTEALAAVAQQAGNVASERWRHWCHAVHLFGVQRIAPKSETFYQNDERAVRSKVQDDELAGIYAPFAEWIKTG